MDSTGLLKLNPLCTWNFHLVEWYIKENNVPRNKLLDQGYRSVGDWHSTVKSGEGDTGERAGRWAGRTEKTECGLHIDYFKMKAAIKQKQVRVHAVWRSRFTMVAELTLTLAGRTGPSGCDADLHVGQAV